ncbi:MAG: ribbon-helix-helix domain-containing protein [Chloroflexota bacterium]|nr:ribbon-helix-helix domain-containing protein [Chloroflexota bacterium]
MSRAYVETSEYLLEGLDEMIQQGFYHDRTEAVNDAIRMLLKNYKLSKLHAKDARERDGAQHGVTSRS